LGPPAVCPSYPRQFYFWEMDVQGKRKKESKGRKSDPQLVLVSLGL
jgi:hypothetical protein